MQTRAIPTIFNGVRYDSRFEAETAAYFAARGIVYVPNCARLKDRTLGEPISFLLPTAGHFLPDFFLPQLKLWVEARWLDDDPRRMRQLEEFPTILPPDQNFMVHWTRNRQEGWMYCWPHAQWIDAPECELIALFGPAKRAIGAA